MNSIRHHNKIIIGGSLAALMYGHRNKIPVVYATPRVPLFFESDSAGRSKQELWHKLSFQLSLAGLMPMSDKAVSLRIEDGGILKAFTDDPFYATFQCGEFVVFDDTNLEGYDSEIEQSHKYRVLDWINDRKSSPHNVDYLESDEDFVKEVYFYPSKRIDGNWSGKKDILAISYLTHDQIDSVEYCDTYVKFKVLHMMRDAGIVGPKNGKNKKDPTKHNHLSIKLETSKREVETVIEGPHSEDKLLEGFELNHRYLDGRKT